MNCVRKHQNTSSLQVLDYDMRNHSATWSVEVTILSQRAPCTLHHAPYTMHHAFIMIYDHVLWCHLHWNRGFLVCVCVCVISNGFWNLLALPLNTLVEIWHHINWLILLLLVEVVLLKGVCIAIVRDTVNILIRGQLLMMVHLSKGEEGLYIYT